jgi:hypothetical protein
MATSDVPPASPAPTPVPAPAKKSNTLVIVLCVVFGLLFLILASCVGTCIYVGKKAKDYAKENQKNPAISQIALAATFAPGIEIVSKDLDAGTIVLKNKKTGEIVKFDSKDFTQDKVNAMIEKLAKGKGVDVALKSETTTTVTESKPDSSESTEKEVPAPAPQAAVSAAQSSAQAVTLKNFRPDFPIYPGKIVTTEATQNTFAGVSSTQHIFETADAPEKVGEYYEKKLTDNGYTVLASENSSDSNGPKISRILQKSEINATVNFEARIEDGKTRVEVNQVALKPQ